jgi:hypothetical protein
LKLLGDNKNVFTPPITRLIWVYSVENKEVFDEVKKIIPKSKFVRGFGAIQMELERGTLFPKQKENDHFLLILDDRTLLLSYVVIFFFVLSHLSNDGSCQQ